MSLAQIATVPQDEAGLSSWSLSHAAHHDDIIRVKNQLQVAASTTLTQFTTYVLDPFDPENMGNWLWQHQQMHNQINVVLGLSGYDLNNFDWQDPGSVADWIAKNYDEHQRIGTILNLG